MYDPSIGRWIKEDPLGFEAGDTDLYRYVFNDPTNLMDPSGLQSPISGLKVNTQPPPVQVTSGGTITNTRLETMTKIYNLEQQFINRQIQLMLAGLMVPPLQIQYLVQYVQQQEMKKN